jgi:hypothetical protein
MLRWQLGPKNKLVHLADVTGSLSAAETHDFQQLLGTYHNKSASVCCCSLYATFLACRMSIALCEAGLTSRTSPEHD